MFWKKILKKKVFLMTQLFLNEVGDLLKRMRTYFFFTFKSKFTKRFKMISEHNFFSATRKHSVVLDYRSDSSRNQ